MDGAGSNANDANERDSERASGKEGEREKRRIGYMVNEDKVSKTPEDLHGWQDIWRAKAHTRIHPLSHSLTPGSFTPVPKRNVT